MRPDLDQCQITPDERRSEAVAILASGLRRLRNRVALVATACFELALNASNLADASLEQSRGFRLCSFAVENHLHHLEHVPYTLTHLHTVPELYLDHLASSSA